MIYNPPNVLNIKVLTLLSPAVQWGDGMAEPVCQKAISMSHVLWTIKCLNLK